MNTEELYDQRVQMFIDTVNHKETKHIPIAIMALTWVLSNSNKTIFDIYEDPSLELKCFEKVWNDVYADATYNTTLGREPRLYKPLGAEPFFYSNDGITMQAREFAFMGEEDYPALINDTKNYIFNKNLLIKYPNLNLNYPQNLTALQESFKFLLEGREKNQVHTARAKEKFGLPNLVITPYINAFDVLMDFFRGLTEIFSDLRRRPEMVLQASEALLPVIMERSFPMDKMPTFPFAATPLHCAGYLTRAQVEKFFLPTFKKALDIIYKKGAKLFVALQGDMDHIIDMFNDFPKDFIIGMIEKSDICAAKDTVGKNISLMGGMPIAMLKYSSKQECIDYAKKIIDTCAPGGGFIFSTDKMLIAKNDVDVENLIAVNEFVHNYK